MATPWHRVVSPRPEVAAGRSFDPDEFAIALEQVVDGRASEDYTDPLKFFQRTSFTRALTENAGLVLRRLMGATANTAPVLSLVTQFGGGKTHTLTTLYHLARSGEAAQADAGVKQFLADAALPFVPQAKVAVFVGNAWDPQPGRETPWIEIARQLAGNEGVALLGTDAMTSPPGTEALQRLFYAAGDSVLLLFDEVLNFVNRHRSKAEPFYAFVQNLTVAMTGTTKAALVISLPRSQVEMTDWDIQWQERITKVVNRVAHNLVANDEEEIADVVRRRLFENLGSDKTRNNVARAYAEWCFDNRAQLPREWTAVDTARSDSQAREFLVKRFQDAYPFHPATLTVFQRKWSTVPQFQATRGTLAMLAQWVSLAYRDAYEHLRNEPLITLGSAPLRSPEFRGIVLGQLGEQRLQVSIGSDLAGDASHARVLDVDTSGALKDIHRRVGSAILFESSGGMVTNVAHLPELRFAIGGPNIDTTSVDTAAHKLEGVSFYLRKVGTDGYQISYRPTLRKVVSERRASLDYQTEVLPEMRRLVRESFEKGRTQPIHFFPEDESAVDDSPRLSLVVTDPASEWSLESRDRIARWTQFRGEARRLYPAALVWCVPQSSKRLRDEIQDWLAWRRVQKDVRDGVLGGELAPGEIHDIDASVREQEREAANEVWNTYRYLALYDPQATDRVREIDLGSGHAGNGQTLNGRVFSALKSQSLLNETIGAGYVDRNWPPALLQSGVWPIKGLRQSVLDGTLPRIPDPDTVLKEQIVHWVERGDMGLASGRSQDGPYDYVWFEEPVPPEDVTFTDGVFLLRKEKARGLKEYASDPVQPPQREVKEGDITGRKYDDVTDESEPTSGRVFGTEIPIPESQETVGPVTLRLQGSVPADTWNRLGTRLIPKLRNRRSLSINVQIEVEVEGGEAASILEEIVQTLEDLQLGDQFNIDSGRMS